MFRILIPERLATMQHQSPMISIVVPTYNRAHLLPRLFNSLLQQTDMRYELIVVDDGSTDPTSALIDEFHLRFNTRLIFVRHPDNRGCNAARNTGVRAATTQWCLFVDSDWELFPDSVQYAIQHTCVGHDVGAVAFLSFHLPGNLVCGYRSGDETWEIAVVPYKDVVLEGDLPGGMFCMIRRSVFCDDGLWFPDWVNGMERLFAARLAKRRQIVAVRRVLGITHFDPGEDRINTHRRWPEGFKRAYETFIKENYDILRPHVRQYRHYLLCAAHCNFYNGSYWRGFLWGCQAMWWKVYLMFRLLLPRARSCSGRCGREGEQQAFSKMPRVS